LLLHFEEANLVAECKCDEIERRLSAVAGGYDKAACDLLPLELAMVHAALARAKALDTDPALIPTRPMSRVYRIIEALRAKDAFDLG
jgi:hypothetical protein